MKRRTFLQASGAVLTSAALGARSAFADSGSLTFVSWGGTTQDAQNECWAVPFTAKTDISVVNDGPTDYGKLKAMVESGNVMWDVVDVEGQFAFKLARDGLLEPLDFTVINKDGLDPRLTFEYGVGSFMSSYVLAYNKDFVKGEPKTWADLFDLEKFPGKRALYKWAGMGVLELAVMADGVKPADIYSPALNGPAGLEDFVGWFVAFLDELAVGDVNVAGHSMGALIAAGTVATVPLK